MSEILTNSIPGLTTTEVLEHRGRYGFNVIEDEVRHPIRLALSKLWAPIPWMLEAAIVLQLATREYTQAVIVASLLLFNAALSFFRESKAQATLDALKKRLTLNASVLRDGQWVTLPATELVPDDLITLSLGTVVAADVRLVDGTALIDQSLITGESLPSDAKAGDVAYAGSLIRRGEAKALVTAIGANTRFGRGAELIRTAHVEGSEQKAIFRVVRNLASFNGAVTIALIAYAFHFHMSVNHIVQLGLVALLASIPVALPLMFTLAGTMGAHQLAVQGVLPTRLSSLDEAACVDILCVDKTGTLTRNELAVSHCSPTAGFDEQRLLALAALASSTAGADPVDAAFRLAASVFEPPADLTLLNFEPFDPAKKMSTATVQTSDGAILAIIKGAYSVIANLTTDSAALAGVAQELEAKGFRVLAVGVGVEGDIHMAGLVALSDPPRDDSRPLIKHLHELGVRTIMVTGDAATTAEFIANSVGIDGEVTAVSQIAHEADFERVGVFASVLPEDKFALVKALQSQGHVVAMCGDGVNDAPALRQAQMGIAVSTATDVAKSAAGLVLTAPGLGGIVSAIEVGRSTFQRILTYTLRSITQKVVQVLFLFGGLIITGRAIITPVLMVLMMITGDLLAMSSSTDNVRPSPMPNVWRIGNLTFTGVILGIFDLAFCTSSILIGRSYWHLDASAIQSLAVITLVFSSQAVFYVSRERQHIWSSRPGRWLIVSSLVDVFIFSTLASSGILMHRLPISIILSVAVAAVGLALILDSVKVTLFHRLAIA